MKTNVVMHVEENSSKFIYTVIDSKLAILKLKQREL